MNIRHSQIRSSGNFWCPRRDCCRDQHWSKWWCYSPSDESTWFSDTGLTCGKIATTQLTADCLQEVLVSELQQCTPKECQGAMFACGLLQKILHIMPVFAARYYSGKVGENHCWIALIQRYFEQTVRNGCKRNTYSFHSKHEDGRASLQVWSRNVIPIKIKHRCYIYQFCFLEGNWIQVWKRWILTRRREKISSKWRIPRPKRKQKRPEIALFLKAWTQSLEWDHT